MKCERLPNNINVKKMLLKLGCTNEGAAIMSKKANLCLFLLKDLKTPAANILKQNALSLGADLALPKEAIVNETEKVDGLLIINERTLPLLLQRTKNQPFGLKELAKKIPPFCHENTLSCQIMGLADDLRMIEKMIKNGANIIEISSDLLLETMHKQDFHDKSVIFCIKSDNINVLEKAFQNGFKMANILHLDEKILNLCAKHNAKICLAYNEKNIQKIKNHKLDDVVLNCDLTLTKNKIKSIQKINQLLHFGYEILADLSEEKEPKSLIFGLECVKNGAKIIKLKKIKKFAKALKIHNKLREY